MGHGRTTEVPPKRNTQDVVCGCDGRGFVGYCVYLGGGGRRTPDFARKVGIFLSFISSRFRASSASRPLLLSYRVNVTVLEALGGHRADTDAPRSRASRVFCCRWRRLDACWHAGGGRHAAERCGPLRSAVMSVSRSTVMSVSMSTVMSVSRSTVSACLQGSPVAGSTESTLVDLTGH